tara:strand:- start:431 stop:676 length:246 start_codon:yes stop_codon:yes gene_type:complete
VKIFTITFSSTDHIIHSFDGHISNGRVMLQHEMRQFHKKAVLQFNATLSVTLLFMISLASTVFLPWDHQCVNSVTKVWLIK